MPDIHKYILSLMRSLEAELVLRELRTEGATIARIAGKLSLETDIDAALSKLYSVTGYDQLALQLMWCAEQVRTLAPEEPSAALQREHVSSLVDTLQVPQEEAQPGATERPSAPNGNGDLAMALTGFDAAVGKLKRDAHEGDAFRGIARGGLDAIVREAQVLGKAATAEASNDVRRFAAAVSSFVDYVTRGQLFHDVRVVNLLENANLTLQTALETGSGEDFDSLQQATELLEMPGAVLETPQGEQPRL